MTIEAGGERELQRLAELARQGAILRRIADLEATIARRRVASLDLSSRGLPTVEVDRTIEILVVSLEFVRSFQAAMDGGAAGARDERRSLAKPAS